MSDASLILVCGEALFDLFLRDSDGPGAFPIDARAGGSPFNVAIGVARRGGRAALLTGLSDDLLGRRLFEVLENEGVETGYLIRSGRRTTLSVVDLATDGQPAYAFYGVGSADCAVTEADLPAIGPEVAALHFGSYSIVETPVADAFAALAAREAGRFISVDPNARPTIAPDPAVWRERLGHLLIHADMVKVSTEDLAFLYPDAPVERVVEAWLGSGPDLVVVTDGGASVSAFTPATRVDIAPPSVTVVDTVGAGDAFQAALLAGLAAAGPLTAGAARLEREAIPPLITAAAEVAAATCARRGADIPRLGEW